jgi:glycosyltransferase involved in cell wall biosynthesis
LALIAAEFLPNWGGAGTYNIRMVKHLMDDVEVHVIAPRRKIRNSAVTYTDDMIRAHFDNKIQIHSICDAEDTFLYNAKFQWSVSRQFGELHRRYQFDLIHTDHPHMSDILYRAPVPTVTTIHTTIGGHLKGIRQSNIRFSRMESSERYQVLLNLPLLAVERIYFRGLKHIITVSQAMKKDLAQTYHLNNVEVIYPGVETGVFVPRRREELTILPDVKVPVVLMSSRMTAAKGASYLIDAMPRILKANDQVHFVFSGSELTEPWKTMLDNNHIDPRHYTFLGYLPYDQLPALHARASIYVCPSLCENLPARVLESMSCGVPAVATNIYGIPEAVLHNQNGLLVPPQDAGALADGILRLLNDEPLRRQLGERARQTVVDRFEWSQLARQIRAVYDSVVVNR